MRKALFPLALILAFTAAARVLPRPPIPPRPFPEPVFRPTAIRANESPVTVATAREIVADNGLYQRVETTVTFTNPNGRVFEGELEFPLPDGATVCGYELEVNGAMVPGVVCEKEQARVAFENEKRQGVDPGIVEHVKGNVWRTRIYPLLPRTPRKAKVVFIVPESGHPADLAVERDGDDVFVGRRRQVARVSRADRLRTAAKARIFWDASLSREGKAQADRNLLECLPETGEWELVVFRNTVEPPLRFTARGELLKAVDALVYDGGTALEEVERLASGATVPVFVFTDEKDVEAAASRPVEVVKLAKGEKPPAEPKAGTLLATAWAANRIADFAAQAEVRKAEFLALGRKYGVASSVTSLIVLERLDQYLRYRIEPPKTLAFHDEWVKRRAASDDPIAAAKDRAEHNRRLLELWEERVTWWNNPIPPKRTPKSGVFGMAREVARRESNGRAGVARAMAAPSESANAAPPPPDLLPPDGMPDVSVDVAESANAVRSANAARSRAKTASDAGVASGAATVKIAAWNPQTPYLKALDAAAAGGAYAEYLVQRKAHGSSPAFYLDCAGWFFKAKERTLAIRILSNLSEMKLEDAALWRTMGWRLREAGAYDEAIAVFRHVFGMRGEEPQARRDLALVLTERGKELFAAGRKDGAAAHLAEAMKLLHEAAFVPTVRRSARRSNDMQTSVLALEELNGLVAWCAANGVKATAPAMDAAFSRQLPLALRIVMSWDVDETDVDLHVLEPDGEEAYYGHRRTSSGGFVSEDVTTGYGPEEYLRKTADRGTYRIMANYFASHRQALTGAATVTATVYTDWATKEEKRQVFSFRLDKPKDKHPIGEIEVK